MLGPGPVSNNGKKLSRFASSEEQWLKQIFDSIKQLSSVVASVNNDVISTFAVGEGLGPVAGATTWKPPIDVVQLIHGSGAVYKNGSTPALVLNTDYSLNILTGVFTLLLTTFTQNDTYTFIY